MLLVLSRRSREEPQCGLGIGILFSAAGPRETTVWFWGISMFYVFNWFRGGAARTTNWSFILFRAWQVGYFGLTRGEFKVYKDS